MLMRSISVLLTLGLLTAAPIILTENGNHPALAQTVDERRTEADSLLRQGFQQLYTSQLRERSSNLGKQATRRVKPLRCWDNQKLICGRDAFKKN
jgi:hypothetical protein